MQTEINLLLISLVKVYTAAIPSVHDYRTAITVGQGPTVLAAGTGWTLFVFLGVLFNFNGVLPGNETVKCFWHFLEHTI